MWKRRQTLWDKEGRDHGGQIVSYRGSKSWAELRSPVSNGLGNEFPPELCCMSVRSDIHSASDNHTCQREAGGSITCIFVCAFVCVLVCARIYIHIAL